MLNLAEYRRRADRLADHLPWAALVAPGIVLNKDGSFQRTLAFRGPDLESATEAELIAACARANNVLKRLGSGWALYFDAERLESQGYPDSNFPDPASALVDRERRAAFEAAGLHFESRYHLTLQWLPPADSIDSAGRALVERPDADKRRDWRGTDAVHASVYHDAARSAAAVGMLAPFVENLFTGIFRGIGKLGVDSLGHGSDSPRSERAKALFWDPHHYFGDGEVKSDLIRGIVQLADSTELRPHLPSDLEPVLQALLSYRNNILHNGLEWPVERREKFANQVTRWPKGWFQKAESNHKPWVWYMSEAFIQRVLGFIDEVLDAAGQHIRLHYVPVGAADHEGAEPESFKP